MGVPPGSGPPEVVGGPCLPCGVTTTERPGLWERRVVPRLVELSLKGHDVGELRRRTCADLHGRVLELGFGSGLNTKFYPDGVDVVEAVEPSDLGWDLSERRRLRSSVPVKRVGLDGQRLAVPDTTYDAVLCTFTLCTIPDPELALSEVRRVLRPGGALHFVEHGLAPTENVQTWQRRLEPLQRRVAGGCHLTRDVPEMLRAAGFELERLDADYLPAPRPARPWTYVVDGVARVR